MPETAQLSPIEVTSPNGDKHQFDSLLRENPNSKNISGIAEKGLEANGFPDAAVDALASIRDKQIPEEPDYLRARMDDNKDVPEPNPGEQIKESSNNTALPMDKGKLERALKADPRFTIISSELSSQGQNEDAAVFDEMRKRYSDVAKQYTAMEREIQKSDEAKEQIANEKRADRIQTHANNEVTKRVNKKFEETHGEFAKTADGVPLDSAQVADYVRMRSEVVAKMNETDKQEIRQKAMTATVVDEYTERNPRPNQNEDPKGFDEWAKGLKDELDQFDEGQKETSTPSGEEVVDNADSAEQEDESSDASWGNARKLAQKANKVNGESEDYPKGKIDDIHNRNPRLKPSFKTRVRLMKISLIGESVLLMAAAGTVGSVTEKIDQKTT